MNEGFSHMVLKNVYFPKQIIKDLLDDKFLILSCSPRYEWQGKIEEDNEVLLVSVDKVL